MIYSVLDLFSGIGGFHLGMAATNRFETKAFCEIDIHASKVLKKRFPDIPNLIDVREVGDIRVDVVCGGFPCQDISTAKRNALGLDGERSGLWYEMLRVIEVNRPLGVFIENVAALRTRGLKEVLDGLAKIGYDAEWYTIAASSVGAPHRRQRMFIIAYPNSERVAGLRVGVSLSKTGQWEWRGAEDLLLLGSRPFAPGKRWPTPLLRRMDDGFPNRSQQLKQVGNAVCVPLITQLAYELANRLDIVTGL